MRVRLLLSRLQRRAGSPQRRARPGPNRVKQLPLILLGFALIGLLPLALLQREVNRAAGASSPGAAEAGRKRPLSPGGRILPARRAANPAAPEAASAPTGSSASAEAERLRERLGQVRLAAGVSRAYGPLIRRLALRPETADAFAALLAHEQAAALDAIQALRAQGIRATAAYVSAVRQAAFPLDQQIADLLGPDGFQAFGAYRQNLLEEATVNQLAERVAGSAPLQDGQRVQFELMLGQMAPAGMRGNEDVLSLLGVQEVPLTGSMVAAAAGVLSPPQLEAFRSMQEAFRARSAVLTYLHARNP